jgi:4-hydroxybenzoate polyprenyltransferase
VAAVAVIAVGEPATALRLGVSMTALQASIGALNDVLDAPADAGRKPGKPIPAGLVTPDAARIVVAVAAAVGLGLAAPSGVGLLVLAGVVLAVGYGYDLVAKGTAWSWLPFAVGIPLLPLYGWLGATGALPAWFAVLWPAAFLAGAALAIGNARVDVERDEAAGRASVASRLGLERAWWVSFGLLGAATAIILVSSAGSGPAVWAGLAIVIAGAVRGRRTTPMGREQGWRLQAIGTGLVAVGWIAPLAT